MENIEHANSLYQVCEILKYTPQNLKIRIPKKFISYFECNKSENYNWQIDEKVPLEKQDLLQETKEILTLLYKDYMCEPEERIKLEKILDENERKYQEELREKYNPDIFNNETASTKTETENIGIANYKQSLFSKIISKIKLVFKK